MIRLCVGVLGGSRRRSCLSSNSKIFKCCREACVAICFGEIASPPGDNLGIFLLVLLIHKYYLISS